MDVHENVLFDAIIEDLEGLWDVGVKMFDVSAKKSFQMHATLLWTINDFPAYGDFSS